jgi:hypothetical protein
MQDTHLSHKNAHTLQQIFQHPATHNLEWHNVVALITQIGTVREEDNGHLTLTLNGISEVCHRSKGKDIADVQQVVDLRHFLEKAGVNQAGKIASPEGSATREGAAETEQHQHGHGRENAEHNRRAEQQLKTQENEQNERSGFMAGDAQAHQQGNKQK